MLKHQNHSKSADLFLFANLQRERGEGEGGLLGQIPVGQLFLRTLAIITYKLHRGRNARGALLLPHEDVQYRANCNAYELQSQ
jgi:hypothetical protein